MTVPEASFPLPIAEYPGNYEAKSRYDLREPKPLTRGTTTNATPSTWASKNTAETLLSGCSQDPLRERGWEQGRAEVRKEMEGRWTQHSTLIDDFFPTSILDSKDIAYSEFLNTQFSQEHLRWKDLIDPFITDENLVVEGFMRLVKKIKVQFGLTRSTRYFKNTSHVRVGPSKTPQSKNRLSPDITLSGKHTSVPPTSIHFSPHSKPPDWIWCMVPFDAKTTKGKNDDEDRYQLGTYVREIFKAHDNRRFVPAFIFTQSILRFYYFDRSGAVVSDVLNYHAQARQFCAIIVSLLSNDARFLGFDTSIRHLDAREYITAHQITEDGSTKPVRYFIEDRIWHSSMLVGDCSICWIAREDGKEEDTDAWFLIKDAWVVRGHLNEGALLEKASLERVKGVAQIVSSEDVKKPGFEENLDSIVNNRPLSVTTDDTHNRIHTRVVMRLHERIRPLEKFSSAKELIIALRDAISGSQALYNLGILHRAVAPFCLFIQPNAPVGDRGVLFDLHCAEQVSSGKHIEPTTGPGVSVIPLDRAGSIAFHSFQAVGLGDPRPPSYLDDLESFYYVLCYMVGGFSGPGLKPLNHVLPRPSFILDWFDGGREKVNDLWVINCPIKVQEYFGTPVKELVQHLHSLFRRRMLSATEATWRPPGLEDYELVIQYFDEAIEAMPEDDEKGGGNDVRLDINGPKESLPKPSKRRNRTISGCSTSTQDAGRPGKRTKTNLETD